MHAYQRLVVLLGCAAAVGLVPAGKAEIVSYRGTAVAEVRQQSPTSPDQVVSREVSSTPTGDPFPLQVIADVVDAERTAAALVAAQVADPQTSITADTDEFAMDMVLNTLSSTLHHQGHAATEEVRTVLFTAAEMGVADGAPMRATGRLFFDGALALLASEEAFDLTGCEVVFTVRVDQERSGQATQTVFQGALRVTGGPARAVNVAAEGQFPQFGVLRTDLSGIDEGLGLFEAFVFPQLQVDYEFDATVGETFVLRAKFGLDGQNTAGGTGVAALVGTPIEAFDEVLSSTETEPSTEKSLTALRSEINAPTGEAAFADDSAVAGWPLLGACGALNLELIIGGLALAGWRAWPPGRRRAEVSRG